MNERHKVCIKIFDLSRVFSNIFLTNSDYSIFTKEKKDEFNKKILEEYLKLLDSIPHKCKYPEPYWGTHEIICDCGCMLDKICQSNGD